MNKIILLGTISIGGKNEKVYARVRIKNGELSIVGVEGPRKNGDCRGISGQIVMGYILQSYKLTPAKGWTRFDVKQFFDMWDRWHLNHMRAGSPRQMELLRKYRDEVRLAPNAYEYACELLEEHNLLIDHSYQLFGAESMTSHGYKYGQSWLQEELPAEVIAYFEALPEAPLTSAWVLA